MKEKLLTLEKFDRAKAWIEAALQDLQRTLAQHDVHVYRELTGTAAVTASPYTHAKWDVLDESVTEYRDGMIVCVKVPVAGNGTYGTGLQINSLGYKPVVYNVNSMVSTRYSVGSVVWAVYNATQTASLYVNSASASAITGCWQVMDYDSNTTSIYTLQRYNGTRVVSADLLRYVIAFRKNETTIIPIHSNAGTGSAANTAVTATTKTMTTESFDPFGEIYQYATNTKIEANDSVNLSTLRTQCASLDARYIFNCNKTLTAQREIYLVVDLQSDGMVKLATSVNPWAQTLPSTNDGHLYILLGYAYSTYQMELYYYHPIYYHDGTQLRQYGGDKTFSGNYNDLTNKPTIPDAVSGQNDGTNWTSLTIGNTTKVIPSGGGSSLPSQTGNSGKFLTTDGTDASWGDIPEEVLVCTLTITTTYNSETDNTDISYSCDKTAAEIYAAYTANKSVILKTAGSDASGYGGPEANVIYRLDVAHSATGPNSNPFYYILFKSQCVAVAEILKAAVPGAFGRLFYNLSLALFDGDLPTDLPINAGWHFTIDTLIISPNIVHGNLPRMDGDTISDSGISATSVSTAVTNSHTHSNKTILDYIPSTLGTAGQVLKVNSGATGLEFGTVSGGLTNHDFTHTANTTVSTSTTTITYAANTRGSQMITVSADIGITFAVNNSSDNYLWIKNSGSEEVDVTISAVTKNSTAVSNVYVPSDGITVPAGGLCEIGVIVNGDGAFITSRNDLAL